MQGCRFRLVPKEKLLLALANPAHASDCSAQLQTTYTKLGRPVSLFQHA
jgi:hypothetical protein